ncbi:hypothetical protein [Pseudomonas sp.]|uniref:hypothetical protein n=1 Tax=Pseudomonas sp. TaxID=306 RepID=UPI003568BE00
MNPGNPYATPHAAVLETRAPDDLIAALPVSVKWRARFRAIQRAGGAQMPDLKQLCAAERRAAFNPERNPHVPR